MERAIGSLIDSLPSIVDVVIYGSLALVAAMLYATAFFAIVGSYYRTASPLLPATKALAAAWTMLVPTAAVFVGLSKAAWKYLYYEYSTVKIIAALVGAPLLLWPFAVALTCLPDFRAANMAQPPAAAPPEAAAGQDVTGSAVQEPQAAEAKKEL